MYKGRDVISGNGVGAAIMRVTTPVLKSVGTNLLKRSILGASKVAADYVLGKSLKDSSMRRFRDEAADLAGDVSHAVMPDVLKSRSRKRKTPGKKKTVKKRKTIF